MKKQEVLEELCSLANKVNRNQFNFTHAADCLCGMNPLSHEPTFNFSREVMEFIKTAVNEKLEKQWENMSATRS